jgi:hypothetical protein
MMHMRTNPASDISNMNSIKFQEKKSIIQLNRILKKGC